LVSTNEAGGPQVVRQAEPEGIRAVIADDHASFRRALSRLLRLDPDIDVIGEASDGREAMDLCMALRPDVALLDFMMPGLKGPEVVAAIRGSLPSTVLLVLSVFGQDAFVQEALDNGADGYLVKGMPSEQLLAAVKEAVAEKRAQSEGEVDALPSGAPAFLGGRTREERGGR
jgi:DNA-binding NarL/FixJ family response regulator